MSRKGRYKHSNRSRKTIAIQTELAESEAIYTVVVQSGHQAAMAAVMVFGERDRGSALSTNAVSIAKARRQRHD